MGRTICYETKINGRFFLRLTWLRLHPQQLPHHLNTRNSKNPARPQSVECTRHELRKENRAWDPPPYAGGPHRRSLRVIHGSPLM